MGLASRGLRDMDQGPETIDDEAELTAVRAQARRIHLQGALVTLVVMAVVVAV